MSWTRNVELKDQIQSGKSIEFLKAEVPTGAFRDVPFAIVRYSLDGERQKYGLRLDLDKQVFLEHFDAQEKECFIQETAKHIVKFLGSETEF